MQVAHQAVSRHLKDRRVGIFIDRHDDPRILDARQMLDRAGDAKRDIQLGSDVASNANRSVGQGAAFAAGASKAVARTVSTRRSPSTLIVANMLPALMGRRYEIEPSVSSIASTSVTIGASSSAAARGKTSLLNVEEVPRRVFAPCFRAASAITVA